MPAERTGTARPGERCVHPAHALRVPHPFPPCRLHRDVLASVKPVFGTEAGTPFIFPGTGTGGWETALTNTLSPGDKVVTFRYGVFSHLWIDMMERLGLDVEVIDEPWGDGAYEDRQAWFLVWFVWVQGK